MLIPYGVKNKLLMFEMIFIIIPIFNKTNYKECGTNTKIQVEFYFFMVYSGFAGGSGGFVDSILDPIVDTLWIKK